MKLIDTHTHLYSEAFDEDRELMIQRAIDAGIDEFFIPAIDSETTQAMYDLKKNYPKRMFLMMGLHPVSVQPETYQQELIHVEKHLASRKFYAVGEIGIDLHWDKTTLGIQQEAFRKQIQWAKKHQLPIVIHCRDAFDEVFEVLEAEKGAGLFGIFHCFTGTLEQAKQAVHYGMKLGIGGVSTFKNGKIDRFLSEIDLDEIVLETDAPYLAPSPYRGKRNESAYLVEIAEKLADVYQIKPEELAKRTTANAKKVFGIS